MNKKCNLGAAMAVVMCLVCASATSQVATAGQREPVPMPTVCQDSVLKHVMNLASETYEGRLAGSRGYDRAATYVEHVLEAYGIEVNEDRFGVECNEVENCKFNIYIPGVKDKRVYTLGKEFSCAGMTGRGYVDAQLVFCGYGIDHQMFDEYAPVDVQGKIAVVLTGLPEKHTLPQSVADRSTQLRDKARAAERHGAIGLIAINVSPSCLPWEAQGRVYCGEMPHMPTFPILQVTLDCGREIMADQPTSLDQALAALATMEQPASYSLTKKAEIDVNARYRSSAPTANVIGVLEGTDPRYRKEYIMVGASLDGAGMQGETCLFPSADINASGVAAVLETARLLSKPEYRPKRSVLFVLFSAGEQQYLGSRHFADNFRKLRRIEAFVNVQNIGYGDSVAVLGAAHYPTLYELALCRDTAVGRHNIARSLPPSEPRGDARVFDAMRLPSLVFTTTNGMHHNHVGSDIWENIDRRILTISTQLVAETVAQLAEGLYVGRSPQSKGYRYGLIQY